jgi:hypothetical protein
LCSFFFLVFNVAAECALFVIFIILTLSSFFLLLFLGSHGFRSFSAAKSMIEVGRHDAAAGVLEDVLYGDDGNPEVWCVLAVCYKTLGDLELAKQYLERCLLMLDGEGSGKGPQLEEQKNQVREMLNEVVSDIKAVGGAGGENAMEEDIEGGDEDL